MSRTTYETPESLAKEDELRKRVELAFGCRVVKIANIAYGFDWMLLDQEDNVLGFAEGKCWGGRSWDRHFFISLLKWVKLRQLSRETRLPVFIVVGFQDGERALDVKRAVPTFKYGGRTATQRDAEDLEPVVYFGECDLKHLGKVRL